MPTRAASAEVFYVLDSTVLIDYLRNRPVVQRVRPLRPRGDVVATTSINVEEVVLGLRLREVGGARLLFDGLVVLPIDAYDGWQAGEWRRDFAARGITLAQADCLIAAAAMRAGATLATGNPGDFPMPEVDIVHWPVGE